mgnify:CR=1 FL=1
MGGFCVQAWVGDWVGGLVFVSVSVSQEPLLLASEVCVELSVDLRWQDSSKRQ